MSKCVLFTMILFGGLIGGCGESASSDGGDNGGGVGNEPPRACQTDENCDTGNACRVGACNQATRLCSYTNFDGDRDGHPSIVCGGDDCDDANGNVHPEVNESCNEKDDDCDGETDNGPDLLTSLQTDRENCGECGNECESGFECQNGQCACGGNQCPIISKCQNGQCVCLEPARANHQDSCNGNCVICVASPFGGIGGICSVAADDFYNCGRCGNQCPWGTDCRNGQCSECEYSREGSQPCNGNCIVCDGGCVNTATDEMNCGRCGNQCAPDQRCEAGRCVN